MRLIVAALLGAIVLFFWGFATHMLLPTGNMGMGNATHEDAILAVLKDGLPAQEGVYMVPGLAPELYEDAAAVAAYSAKAAANPNAVIVYQPVGRDGMQMGPQMGTEFATCALAALLAAWVMSLSPFGFGKRVGIATVMGLFAWLVVSVPYWNWYRFPMDFTVAAFIMTVGGWFLAGLPMAWWLGRNRR